MFHPSNTCFSKQTTETEIKIFKNQSCQTENEKQQKKLFFYKIGFHFFILQILQKKVNLIHHLRLPSPTREIGEQIDDSKRLKSTTNDDKPSTQAAPFVISNSDMKIKSTKAINQNRSKLKSLINRQSFNKDSTIIKKRNY